MRIEPIKPSIGARVHADRDALCTGEVVAACADALEKHGVLVFPRLGLTDEEQLAFTAQLGNGGESVKFPGGAALEENIFKIAFDPNDEGRNDYVKVSFFWHIDGMCANAPLPKAALLTARSVAKRGGQTEFANTIVAYERLPQAEKSEIAELEALHTPAAGFRWVVDQPTHEERARWGAHAFEKKHPIVWRQPTGRRSLLLSTTADHIVGMPLPEGRALLSRLVEWTVQPDFKYRHEWQEGDLLIWNNHGVMHRVIPYDASSGRSMHRTSIESLRAH